jgi:chemotaxis signal transduction protein
VTSDSLRSALPDGGARSAGAPGRESDAEAVGTDDPPPGESNAPATAGEENGAAESTDEVDHPETDAGEDEVDDGGDRDEETLQVLEFALSEDPYAVTIGEVGAIVEMKQITRFPRGPDAVDGVTDLRGEITAVLDPKRLLDIETDDGPSTEDYIVVLDRTGDKQKVAVRVDDVIRVQRYAESDVDRNGDLETLETDSLDAEMIDGVLYKDDDGNEAVDLVPWLNIDTIVDNVD